MYVALSFVRDIKNLHLMGRYNRNTFTVNSYVTLKYNRLQESSYFLPLNKVNIKRNCLTVFFAKHKILKKKCSRYCKR